MSLGPTTSAPAAAWLTAVRASSSSVASLSTSLAVEHAAVAVRGVLAEADVGQEHQLRESRRAARAARAARSRPRPTRPSRPRPSPRGSRTASRRARRAHAASSASATSSSTEWRPSAGRSGFGSVRRPDEERETKSSRSRRVSRTSERRRSLRRSRRRRVAGKALSHNLRAASRASPPKTAPSATSHAPPAGRSPRAQVVERRAEQPHGVRERERVADPARRGHDLAPGRGRRRRSASRRARATSEAERASRASAPTRAPSAPSAPPASTSPTTSSGSRRHGSPPVTPPISMTRRTRARSRARARARPLRRARPSPRPARPSPTRPRASRPITFSSRSAASDPAASSSARNVIVSAERVRLHLRREHPGPARGPASRTSSIGCAVARSASPVLASASRASWRKSRSRAVPRRVGHRARAASRPSRCPSTSIGLPRKLPSPPCRISVT